MPYKRIDPTADCGIEVWGADLKSLFQNAGLALFDLIADSGRIEPAMEDTIHVDGSDWADLMVNWLRELLYFWTGKEMLIKEIAVREIAEFRLSAAIRLEPYDPEKHLLNHEIKAVTYHGLQVTPFSDGWKSTIVFDV
jgi:SHS2 domain-containing protein